MKKNSLLLLLLFSLLSTNSIFSQISIQPKTYPTSSFSLSSLWNQSIVNFGPKTKVILEGFVAMSSAEIVTITSQVVELENGLTQFTANDIFVNNKNILSSYPYYDFINMTNTLPFGEFDICFRVKDAQTQVELTRFCSPTIISPSSPPMLISPADEEEIYTPLPTFSWFSPSPVLYGMNITYDIKIVEVFNSQSPEDAIQINNPIVLEEDIPSTFFAYSISHTPLKYDTYYAWQIVAKNSLLIADANGSFKDIIAQSEVSTFILRNLPSANPLECYHTISEQINSTPETINKKLRILFLNPDQQTGPLDYELTDSADNVINLNESYIINRGANRFVFDLTSIPSIKANGTYIFTIKGINNKEYQLKFKYTN